MHFYHRGVILNLQRFIIAINLTWIRSLELFRSIWTQFGSEKDLSIPRFVDSLTGGLVYGLDWFASSLP